MTDRRLGNPSSVPDTARGLAPQIALTVSLALWVPIANQPAQAQAGFFVGGGLGWGREHAETAQIVGQPITRCTHGASYHDCVQGSARGLTGHLRIGYATYLENVPYLTRGAALLEVELHPFELGTGYGHSAWALGFWQSR